MKMVRILLYVAILGSLLLVPLKRIEIKYLKPIEGVWIYKDNDEITLMTDTENMGVGRTVEAALQNMKDNTSGLVYLNTARYVLVADTAVEEISAIKDLVHSAARVCKWNGEGDLAGALNYATAHKIGVKMAALDVFGNLPEIPVVNE